MTRRECAWCHGDITGRRKDAIYCSKRCRQASHRFHHAVGAAARPEHDQLAPLRLAYADPRIRAWQPATTGITRITPGRWITPG